MTYTNEFYSGFSFQLTARIRHNEQRKGNFIPYLPCFQDNIRIAESGKPETFLHTRFGMIIGVITSQYSFSGNGVRQCKHRSIQRYREAVPLCLKEFLVRGIAQLQLRRTGREVFNRRVSLTVFPQKRNQVARFIRPPACR